MRHVDTAPTPAARAENTPHSDVTTLTGGAWPAPRSTATPCPFCTTRTVTASGITSSTMACRDHCGTWGTGRASQSETDPPARRNVPDTATATAPTTSAPRIGGTRRPAAAQALSSTNTTTMGPATAVSDTTAFTSPVPKPRNTPATIAITIGIGIASIAVRTQPDRPSTRMSNAVPR